MGILLHYSTLATALWVGVTARNIYKQVTRKAKRYEELDEPPPPPRPMLRYDTAALTVQPEKSVCYKKQHMLAYVALIFARWHLQMIV